MQRVRELLHSDEPVTWLFYGDSITHGALHTFGHRDYSELFSERVRSEAARPHDIVLKTAISGHTSRDLLHGFEKRVRRFAPDVVFIMIGMNDCSATRDVSPDEFRANVSLLCRQIEAFGLPVLQTTCPILPAAAPDREARWETYMDIVREIAATQNRPLIDHARFWQQATADNPNRLFFWMSNAFHPNQWGHRAFAALIFQELEIFDEEAFSCRLFYP